jgi:glycosyltransferase involved in cell wall biosynthesis
VRITLCNGHPVVKPASLTSSLRHAHQGLILSHNNRRLISVDTDLLHIRDKGFIPDLRPVFLYVGRVAVEKNIEAFLTLDLPGTKYVVGDGPQLKRLMRAFPKVRFVGAKKGEALAKFYAAADVFVFPNGKKVPNSLSITLFR